MGNRLRARFCAQHHTVKESLSPRFTVQDVFFSRELTGPLRCGLVMIGILVI
jgi:hypothetical protein